MPRIILTSRYLKPSRAGHRSYLVKYIATRDGAEPVPATDAMLPASKKQERLISQILKDFPDAKGSHEYADYMSCKNRKNASEFITQVIENNIDRAGSRRNYVDYVANRPRVEKLGAHGLFTDNTAPVVLDRVAEDVSNHSGNIWTTVISLRREDAARLGYDNADAWMAEIRGKRNLIAECMKIRPDNLKWYAAFHNEAHHPHVHLIAYSIKPKEGYLTETGIEKMRSAFARDIFRQDLIQIYEKQTKRRGAVNEQTQDTLRELIARMRSGASINKQLESDLLLLAQKLGNTRGKKVYGYLQPDVKAIINRIIDELSKIDSVAKAYAAWYEMRNEVLLTYSDTLPEPEPLSAQKEFKKIRQIVIDEAMRIVRGELMSEPDAQEEIEDASAPEESSGSSASDYNANNSYSPSAVNLFTRLINQLSRMFEDEVNRTSKQYRSDSKTRRKEREKKIAQGHARDDHEQEQGV